MVVPATDVISVYFFFFLFWLSLSVSQQEAICILTVMLCTSIRMWNRPIAFPFRCNEMKTVYRVRTTESIRCVWHSRRPWRVPDVPNNRAPTSDDCNRRTACTVTQCHSLGRWICAGFLVYSPTLCIPMACTGICWANIVLNRAVTTHESFWWQNEQANKLPINKI